MKHWWVNQNQTFQQEVEGGYLWSPKVKADGTFNQFYENMCHVAPGDIVFSFCDTLVQAIGIVLADAETAPKPSEFRQAGKNWNQNGWLVRVEFYYLENPIRPADHMNLLKPLLPLKYAPLRASGKGNQGVYLAELPDRFAGALRTLLRGQVEKFEASGAGVLAQEGFDRIYDERVKQQTEQRTDIGPTEKRQLVNARLGQGIYRANLWKVERGCRLTGVTDPAHLRASHIKPWRVSNDREKIDGYNGLLLTPHFDHLFDRGYITFMNNGDLVTSGKLDGSIKVLWKIDRKVNVGGFNSEQVVYLAHHREHEFEKWIKKLK